MLSYTPISNRSAERQNDWYSIRDESARAKPRSGRARGRRSPLAHLMNRRDVVGLRENPRAGNKNVCTRRFGVRDVRQLDAAIDFDVERKSAPQELAPNFAHLIERGWDEGLA